MNLAQQTLQAGSRPDIADRPAFFTSNGPVSHAEFHRIVFAAASGISALGVRPGEKVLLRLTNSIEFAAAFLGAIWIGAVPVLQNSQFGRNEIKHVAELSRPTAVLHAAVPSGDEPTLEIIPHVHRAVMTKSGMFSLSGERLGEAAGNLGDPFDVRADDIAFVVFTSGTTGNPKGVMHAHRWLAALGDSNLARVPPEPGDVVLATGEWSFISALGHNVLFPLRNGVAGSILEERASPERILAAIARDGVTLLHSVATLYRRILSITGIEKEFDLTSLRGANSTGESLEGSVRKEWLSRIGCPIWEHYGVSEAQMVIGDGPGTAQRPGSVGKPWSVRAAILDDDFLPLPAGAVGTLAFDASYPGFFLGYLGDKERTNSVLKRGWFLTSDLARIDEDDYVYILGRVDDCFKSKGILIAPSELEAAILSLGAFEEACVFAVPDAEIGNRIGAAVVPRTNASPDLSERRGLVDALAGLIAPFKIPHLVISMKQLPKNPNGKTQRTEVARLALMRCG